MVLQSLSQEVAELQHKSRQSGALAHTSNQLYTVRTAYWYLQNNFLWPNSIKKFFLMLLGRAFM